MDKKATTVKSKIGLSKTKHFKTFKKSLKGTSKVDRCTSTLNNTRSTNHSAPIHSKTQSSTKTDSGGFHILLCNYRTHSQIHEDTRKMYEMHSYT